MPATFDPDALRASLRPLADAQPLSAAAQAYQRFYGLDLPARTTPFTSRLGSLRSGTFIIVSQLWLPQNPVATLFLFHGFYDHMGLYRNVIDWALDRGFAVISCDLPGHGLSSGERASIEDFAEYQRALQGLFDEARSWTCRSPGTCSARAPAAPSWSTTCSSMAWTVRPRARWCCCRRWCGHGPGVGRSSATTCSGRSSKALPDASARTPMTRRSCRSCRPTRCSHSACRPPGSVPWPAGFQVSRAPRQARAGR